jgi:multiple sugar transport system substrate-binding protein
MTINSRLCFAACFATLFSLLAVGCAKKPQQHSDKIQISFWHAMGPSHAVVINNVVREFEALHPNIKVNAVYQGGYDQLHTKLIAAIAAKKNPTMSQLYESWTTLLIERNMIEPVENYFSGPDGLSREEFEDIVAVFREDNSWNGKMMTLPFNKSAYALFANEDMLRAAGISHPPRTWTELRDDARLLTHVAPGGGKVYGFATRPLIESFSTMLFLNDGRFVDERTRAILFNSREGAEALQLLVDMVRTDHSAYVEAAYLTDAFGAQRVAMFISSTAGFPYVDKSAQGKFKWIAAPMPHPEGKTGRVLFQGTNVGIFSQSSSEEKRAAWLFLKMMTNTKNATKWSIVTGYLPIRYSVLKTPEMTNYLEKNPNYRVVVAQLDDGIFEPRAPYWESMRSVITDEVEAALMGRKSVKQALSDATDRCDYILRTE